MQTKQYQDLQAKLGRMKKAVRDNLGEGFWGLKKETDKFTHEEIVFLFARVFPSYDIEYFKEIRTQFPDCICVRDGKEIGIEFEPTLSTFSDHLRKDDPKKCQCIVCWEDDKKFGGSIRDKIEKHGIEIIELKKYYEEWKLKDRPPKGAVITQDDIDNFTPNQMRVVKAFVEARKDILTREEISEAIGVFGKGLGGALRGFPELEKKG